MTSLKEQKEAFVTGHQGTCPQEILLVCASGIVGYWLFAVLPSNLTTVRPLSTEVYLFWLPMILVQSNFLYPWGVGYLCIEVVLAVILEVQLGKSFWPTDGDDDSTTNDQSTARESSSTTASQSNPQQQQHGALTMHRVIVMYLTFVAILAVDFPLFPRRFVKTETSGYSLMDVGAASFALVAGLVSPRARYGASSSSSSRTTSSSWTKELRRMAPLVFMGSLRLLTHQELDYQEHVSEYGVHWNFFFTLAALGPLTAALPGPTWFVPTTMMMVYQYCLSFAGWQTLIEDAPRQCVENESVLCNLFMANREGLLGCIGYVSIYLIGEWIGSKALWVSSTPADTIKLLVYASGAVMLLWRLFVVMGIPISRRSTNLGFVLWSLVVNLPLSTVIMMIYQRHGKVPLLAGLVNRYGLVCFIVANLLTGIVNLSINTLQVEDLTAIAILVTYLTAVGMFAMLLDGILSLFARKPKQA